MNLTNIHLDNLPYTKTNEAGVIIDDNNPNAAWPNYALGADAGLNDRWLFFKHPKFGWARINVSRDQAIAIDAFDLLIDDENPCISDLSIFFTTCGTVIEHIGIANILLNGQVLRTKTGAIYFSSRYDDAHMINVIESVFIPYTDTRFENVRQLRNLNTLNSMYGRRELSGKDKIALFKRVGLKYDIY